jgi:hypothetical protein
MQDAAGMAVPSLVEKLVGRLQDEVGDEMLELQDQERRKYEKDVFGHGAVL